MPINVEAPHGTPIACTLTPEAAEHQLLEWADLQRQASAVTRIEGGVRMTLPSTLIADVNDLVRRETACCAFLTIATSVVDNELMLDVASENPDALPVILALAGIPLA